MENKTNTKLTYFLGTFLDQYIIESELIEIEETLENGADIPVHSRCVSDDREICNGTVQNTLQ